MQIAKIENSLVVQLAHYTDMFPNTGFTSAGPSPDFLQENSCLPVTVFLSYDNKLEKLESVPPYILNNQVYTVQVVPLSAEDIEQRSLSKANTIRNQRTQLLQDSDWTQVADAPVDRAVWAIYRQELRDITTHPEFPWQITWPQTPV